MYGAPGAVRNATVNEVISEVENERDERLLPSFQHIKVKGMKVAAPNQVHSCFFISNNFEFSSRLLLDLKGLSWLNLLINKVRFIFLPTISHFCVSFCQHKVP